MPSSFVIFLLEFLCVLTVVFLVSVPGWDGIYSTITF